MKVPHEDITKSMPFSNDAEKGVLSCFLHNPTDLIPDAKHDMPPEAFYHPANRTLYEVFLELWDDERPIDYLLLTQWLTDKGKIDKIGGQGALAELLDFVPTPTHYGYYKGIVLQKYRLRFGIRICTEAIQDAYEFQNDNLDEWSRKLAAGAMELKRQCLEGCKLADGADIGQVHDEMVDVMYEKGPSTGFQWMDRIFGGLIETGLILFQGRRGIGKSAITRQIAWSAAKRKIPTEVVTVEMTKVQYYEGICQLEGVDGNSFLQKTFTKADLDILNSMRSRAKEIPLRLHEDARTIDAVITLMETAKLKRNARLFVVDMPSRLIGNKSEGRERELSGIFADLKDAAKRLRVTVLTPVHLNSALIARGSEDIENHADQIVMMAKGKDKPTLLQTWTSQMLLKATKNRYGPEGGRCIYHFTGKHVRFDEAEETELDIEPAPESRPKRGER